MKPHLVIASLFAEDDSDKPVHKSNSSMLCLDNYNSKNISSQLVLPYLTQCIHAHVSNTLCFERMESAENVKIAAFDWPGPIASTATAEADLFADRHDIWASDDVVELSSCGMVWLGRLFMSIVANLEYCRTTMLECAGILMPLLSILRS